MKAFFKTLSLVLVALFSVNAFGGAIVPPPSPTPSNTITFNFDDVDLNQSWGNVTNAWGDVPSNYHGYVWTGWEAMSLAAYNRPLSKVLATC